MPRVIVAVAVLVLVAFLGFFFWIGGGFDLFKPPVEIAIPAGYSGPVCAKALAGSEAVATNRYEVSQNGLLPIDEGTLRSPVSGAWGRTCRGASSLL